PSTRYVGTNLVGTGMVFGGDAGGTVWLLGPDEEGIKRCPTRVSSPVTDGLGPLTFFSGSTSYGYNRVGYIGPKGLPSGESLGLIKGIGSDPNATYRLLREAEVLVPSDMIAL